jgi:hypothetical protein
MDFEAGSDHHQQQQSGYGACVRALGRGRPAASGSSDDGLIDWLTAGMTLQMNE